MINQNKLLQALNLREDDSKRIDLILEAMASRTDLQDLTILYFDTGYSMYYDAEFKVFQVDNEGTEITVFKDGREAIDYCISPPLDEESSDEVKADDNEVPNEVLKPEENKENT